MSEHIIRIKNMVCPRCQSSVERIAEKLNLQAIEVGLGYVRTTVAATSAQLNDFAKHLQAEGFELLNERRGQITEEVKHTIIRHFYGEEKKPNNLNFSSWLSQKINVSYNHLSMIFSEEEGITIENYVIKQRIERAKELLSYGTKSMAEISDELEYSSPQYFSGQFKKITGISPTDYKKLGGNTRQNISEV